MSLTLALEIVGVIIGFAAVIITVLTQGRKSREEFTQALHKIDSRVGIIDSHTSGNAERFNKIEAKIEALQKITSAHTGSIEYNSAQVEKAERRLDAMQSTR